MNAPNALNVVVKRSTPISPSYTKAMAESAVLQAVVILFSSFLSEGGAVLQLCLMALVAYWGGVLCLVWRRPRHPTRFDLSLIRIGYLLVLIVTMLLAPLIWHFRGVL